MQTPVGQFGHGCSSGAEPGRRTQCLGSARCLRRVRFPALCAAGLAALRRTGPALPNWGPAGRLTVRALAVTLVLWSAYARVQHLVRSPISGVLFWRRAALPAPRAGPARSSSVALDDRFLLLPYALGPKRRSVVAPLWGGRSLLSYRVEYDDVARARSVRCAMSFFCTQPHSLAPLYSPMLSATSALRWRLSALSCAGRAPLFPCAPHPCLYLDGIIKRHPTGTPSRSAEG